MKGLVSLALLLSIFMLTAKAQTQAINGSIRGRVTDPAGAAIGRPRSQWLTKPPAFAAN